MESIAYWIATGFFLGESSFYSNKIIEDNKNNKSWEWHHSPRNLTLDQCVSEFGELLEDLVKTDTKGKKIILPLSGGLDSRTLAAALKNVKDIVVISYEFDNGISETKYAEKLAKIYNWEFHRYKIPKSYLWSKIGQISSINECKTEFTHPRQAAVIDEITKHGNIILSGLWGDVLFDNADIKDNVSKTHQTDFILNNISKIGGVELANDLWNHWNLENSFDENFFMEVYKMLDIINIENPKSKFRAFKSLFWATSWSSTNLKFFNNNIETSTPYLNDKMFDFVCTVPEKFLSKRIIQIEYIKRNAPELAKIEWQEYELDLYKYKYFNSIYYPRRIYQFAKRSIMQRFYNHKPKILRNWELQFLGSKNNQNLKDWLFGNYDFLKFVPEEIVKDYYYRFKNNDPVKYSHPISMLLTLSVFIRLFHLKGE